MFYYDFKSINPSTPRMHEIPVVFSYASIKNPRPILTHSQYFIKIRIFTYLLTNLNNILF